MAKLDGNSEARKVKRDLLNLLVRYPLDDPANHQAWLTYAKDMLLTFGLLDADIRLRMKGAKK